MPYVLLIVLGADQTDARRRASFDLVLQARSRAIPEEAVVALTDRKNLLQVIQGLPHGGRAGKRPEIPPRRPARAPMIAQAGKLLLAGQIYVGIALIVA